MGNLNQVGNDEMAPGQLLRRIRGLREKPPITTGLENVLTRRGTWDSNRTWYSSQKEHWIGWLSEYGGPGYYDRKKWNRSAKFVYNHICCPPMVLWLGEAAGLPKSIVLKAKSAALSAPPNYSAQCAAIRRHIPWDEIEQRLTLSRSNN